MEIALVPQRAARASPVFAASVVVAAGASDIGEVNIIAQRRWPTGGGPVLICAPPKVQVEKRGPKSPEGWSAKILDGGREVEVALFVKSELSLANVRPFGAKKGGTHCACVIVGPNGQGFDASHVLHDGERTEAGAGGAGALEVNGVNRAEAGFGEVGDKSLKEVQGVFK